MAKRRAAEPLVFHAPWKRLLRGLPDGPPCWVSPPRKRRMDAAAAVAEPPPEPRKRRGGGQPEGRGLDTGEPPPRAPEPGEQPDARAPRGGGDGGAGRGGSPRGDWGAAPERLNEEFWQYNTFQYWRNPLPPIDLADIEAVNEDNLAKAKLQGQSEVVEVDMES
ncbi:uncharacterized protein C9orf40-like [Erinaceus europaeus]|uniref:Uncharacterized protein C9orf40-like n=1 Tax=Erinaceus europaeus TaxID=9365 RepID=A0ABM3Y1K7_ERIEU|nr:uncharacterized protein C9orf40-like [Erinaceus europaeus]